MQLAEPKSDLPSLTQLFLMESSLSLQVRDYVNAIDFAKEAVDAAKTPEEEDHAVEQLLKARLEQEQMA